jgi:hypothetical protein
MMILNFYLDRLAFRQPNFLLLQKLEAGLYAIKFYRIRHDLNTTQLFFQAVNRKENSK